MMKRLIQTLFLGLMTMAAMAQLSSNPDKFLGNITTYGQVDDDSSAKFYRLWNQITPENESKWSSVQGGGSTSWNWGGCDNCVNYARNHHFPFKFHTLVWGAQFPEWVKSLSVQQRYDAIVNWMDAVKSRYPNLALIDVVNEAVEGHQSDTHYLSEALGGGGVTGYDWIIKAFELAYERWPNAILIYNDFNTFQWNTDQFIDLVRTIRDAGAPVDAYGCQSHDMLNWEGTDVAPTFKSSMDKMHSELMMPMYSTEYDVGTNSDDLQLKAFMEQIPYMWESDYCAGITLWGYIYGKTWTGSQENGTKGNSGIIKEGEDRPAMAWLRDYMASNKARQAKSPFPGMKKELSLYVKPASLSATVHEPLSITVTAQPTEESGKTVKKVELYVKNNLVTTLTKAPYTTAYTPTATGKHALKAVVTTTDGKTYERLSSFTAYRARAPFNGVIDLPGTIEGENFDSGAEGIAYHDSDSQNQGSGKSYRSDAGSVDVESFGNGGYAIGWTHAGEWLEYTVNVKEAGLYEFDAYVASQDGGGSFSLALSGADGLTDLTGEISVLKTGSWGTYNVQSGRFVKQLAEGQQVLRLIIRSGDLLFNIDKIVLRRIAESDLRLPYKSVSLPGTIQFEDFDMGLEGYTYHDSDEKKDGEAGYRSDCQGVDIVSGNGGYAIGYTLVNEWLEYTVNVTKAGTYSFEAVVASGATNASFTVSLMNNDTATQLCTVDIPQTAENDWGVYRTVSGDLSIPLEKGKQILRVTITGAYGNLDKMTFIHQNIPGDINEDGSLDDGDIATLSNMITSEDNATVTPALEHTPFREMELPGTIEAEDFNYDAYSDTDEQDRGKPADAETWYRMSSVDIYSTPDGGYAIGYTIADEWVEYTVDVKKEGIYSFEAVVSSGFDDSSFSLSLRTKDGLTALTEAVAVPCVVKDNWDNYAKVEGRLLVPLQKGLQVIRLTVTGSWCNIDKIKFSHVTGSGTLKGDYNSDGDVDIADITKLIELFLNNK